MVIRPPFATALAAIGLTGVASVVTAAAADSPETAVDLCQVSLYKSVVYGPTGPDAPLLNAFVIKSDAPSPVLVQITSSGWLNRDYSTATSFK